MHNANIKLAVTLTDNYTLIELAENQGQILISTTNNVGISVIDQVAIYFALKEDNVLAIGFLDDTFESSIRSLETDKMIVVFLPKDVDAEQFKSIAIHRAQLSGAALGDAAIDKEIISGDSVKRGNEYFENIQRILERFGCPILTIEASPPAKEMQKKPAKAQHRWNKAVSQIPFFIDARDSRGTIVWQKRNELLLKAGAKLKRDAPLNKNGSFGFNVRFAEKIRQEYADKINDATTTEDIILRSINEVGLFLYYGGTNGWLEFKDDEGKTIHDWTVVE